MRDREIEMTNEWMERLKRAWEGKKVGDVLSLFSQKVKYCESPYESWVFGREAVAGLWSEINDQEDVRVSYQVLLACGGLSFVEWSAEYKVKRENFELKGVYFLKLNGDGLCSEFRQWWMNKEH